MLNWKIIQSYGLLFVFRIVVFAFLFVMTKASAEETQRVLALRQEMERRAEELSKLQQTINLSSDKEVLLIAEIEALEKSRSVINEELITAAQRARTLEESIIKSEDKLDQLLQNEETIRLSLIERRALLIEILASLQRMGQAPPPALLVRPEDVLDAIRSAILIQSVLPDVKIQAESLAADLEDLVLIRQEAEEETEKLKMDFRALGEEQTRLALLLEEKRRALRQSTSELAAQKDQVEELANQATSLQQLIESMEVDIAAARKAAEEARQAEETAQREKLEQPEQQAEEAKLTAFSDQGRISPAIRFEDAKGLLPLPVSGRIISNYNDDEIGGKTKGLKLLVRPGSAVISPADGWVVYAGPFRSYGQILILNAGDNYHIVLAGLTNINVELGQFVLSGEPVASMGSGGGTDIALVTNGVSRENLTLYVEFRKDEVSIDPSPWWKSQINNNKSG